MRTSIREKRVVWRVEKNGLIVGWATEWASGPLTPTFFLRCGRHQVMRAMTLQFTLLLSVLESQPRMHNKHSKYSKYSKHGSGNHVRAVVYKVLYTDAKRR